MILVMMNDRGWQGGHRRGDLCKRERERKRERETEAFNY
uniref:Uncharacterized protein n=1 Tax=Anguilla anguilla TaxID=7936 RepID=A0A0E9PZF4_ANGAN